MPREGASGLMRSEDMVKVDLVVTREQAHDLLYHIGVAGVAEFVDMNTSATAFQRDYTAEVRRCDDLERRLRYFAEQMTATAVEVVPMQTEGRAPRPESLDQLEQLLESKEGELRELNAALESLYTERNRCREITEVARCGFFGGVDVEGYTAVNGGGGPAATVGNSLLAISGVIPIKNLEPLLYTVFRISRGNSVVRHDEIAESFVDLNSFETKKSVFVVYVGSQRLMDKVKRCVEAFGGTTYPTPTDGGNTAQLRQQLSSINDAIEQSLVRKINVLRTLAGSYESWYRTVLAEKFIFRTLNLFDLRGTVGTAQLWIPEEDMEAFHAAIDDAGKPGEVRPVVRRSPDQSRPPTFFRTNKYTEVFQGIVDSYGVAHYKEVNPGVLTIVTFPYLFGIMYGDIGHGFLLTAFAALLVLLENRFLGKPLNEIFAMIFGGRYLLLGMGIFAVYIGVLYNDFFGFSIELFSTGYIWPELPPKGPNGIVTPLRPNGRPSVRPPTTVPFGIDSAWAEAENKLEFYNSIKMKCAVIIGVVQMLVGIILSLFNHLRNKDTRQVLFRFIPEITFLSCTFGYMSILIIAKWCMKWENTNLAPSLLETMTNFFLSPGTVTVPLFDGQAQVQVVLLLVAFAQVPIMLCVIPYLERRDHSPAHGHGHAQPQASVTGYQAVPSNHELEDGGHSGGHSGHGSGEFDFSEVVIHYVIHTIEFVLGCVSNTASYLRLWALSLAHAQLSEVFLNFGLVGALNADSGSGVVLFIGFAVWLGATIGVLLLMESLSAFLHALRLHWVEFQNKFYLGDGFAFTPFALETLTRLPF